MLLQAMKYGLNWKRTILRDDNEQHMKFNVIMRRIYYAKKQISLLKYWHLR